MSQTSSHWKFQQSFKQTALAILLIVVAAAQALPPAFAQVATKEEFERRHPKVSLTQAQLWAMACPALLSEHNQERHDLLWCYDPTQQRIEKTQDLLLEWWDIGSHDEVLKRLDWLDRGGQRVEFDRIVKVQNAPPPIRDSYIKLLKKHYGEVEFNRKWNFVQQYKNKVGAKSLIGWDFCRIISICRWSVLAEYISEAEAWSRIMPAAKKLQSTFSSWDDMSTNYMIGRNFWRSDVSSYDTIKQKLLTDSSSPWKKIPWNTRL